MSGVKYHIGGQSAVFPLYKLKPAKAQKSRVLSNCLASLSGSCKDKANKQNLRDCLEGWSRTNSGDLGTQDCYSLCPSSAELQSASQRLSQAQDILNASKLPKIRPLIFGFKDQSLRKLLIIIHFQFLCKYYSQSQISIEVSGAKK